MIGYSLMTTEEVAEKLRCSRHYVTHLRKHNAFTGFKIGKRWMYKEEEINAFIDRSVQVQAANSRKVIHNALGKRM